MNPSSSFKESIS